jgi:NADPH-dependent curcumin reductase CurA
MSRLTNQSVGWCEYAITKDVQKVVPPPGAMALDFLSVLGFTGLTAYFGLLDICHPQAGETVVVSGAAGAVGMSAAQIAKIKGCRVVGIAGGEEKCRFLKQELGLDEVVDYKADNFKEALEKATPKYIDVFFDNGNYNLVIADQSGGNDLGGMPCESS